MILLCLLVALADPRIAEGERLYGELEFEQAVVVLQDVLADASLAPPDRARALVFLGLSQAQIGKSAPAQVSFTAAFRADPSVAVPAGLPEKIQTLIDNAKAEAASTPSSGTPGKDMRLPLAIGGLGSVVLVGGVTVGAVSLAQWTEATDPETTQRRAVELGEDANTLMTVAVIVTSIGVVGVATAVALAVVE